MMTSASRPRVTFLSRASSLAVALLVLSTACGQVHSTIPVDTTARDIAQSVCSSAYRCCTLAQLMNNDAAGTSVATATQDCTADSAPCEQACEARTAENFRNELSGVQRSVDQRRAVYEQAKVDACLAKIRSSSCETINVTNHLTGVPGCESFVTPLVAVGGGCTNDYECIDGWCRQPTPPETGDGTCAPLARVGEACAAGNCAPGLACDPKGSDPADDVCVQAGDVGAVCSDAFECKSGACSSSGGSGKTCAPTGGMSGGMCFYSSGCSIAGGRPGPGAALGLAALLGIAVARGRRRRHLGGARR